MFAEPGPLVVCINIRADKNNKIFMHKSFLIPAINYSNFSVHEVSGPLTMVMIHFSLFFKNLKTLMAIKHGKITCLLNKFENNHVSSMV